MNIITKNAFFEQNIQKSKFLAFSYYVQSEQEALNYIKQLQDKYCDCRHVVYAYKIGENIEKKGNSSEPAGTAGAPIFLCIKNNNLTNVLIVVVRYFGGILLGAQNLYRAYLTSASGVLELSQIKEQKQYNVCSLLCSYTTYSALQDFADKYNSIKLLNVEFGESITIKVAFVNESDNKELQSLVKQQKPKVEKIWL